MNAIRAWINYNKTDFKLIQDQCMAMSITQMNDISYYQKIEMLAGHEDFERTMSRDNFMNICTNIQFLVE